MSDHGPEMAFPSGADSIHDSARGLTKREWFAGQALAGLCANPDLAERRTDLVAVEAFELADAMMERRDK